MSNAADAIPPYDAVVNEDGSVTVSREQVAALNLKPGSHLSLFPSPKRRSIAEILDANAEWQKAQGVELSEEEAERLAVEASREIRERLNDQARKGA